MQPRVSYIVTCYNYARFVVQAVDSLLDQTLQELEVIVIDDASTDNSAEVLARYADDPRVRVMRHASNQRHIRSYNEGISMARGEFVGVVAADDFCVNAAAAAQQVAIFDAHPEVGYVHAAHVFADEQGRHVWVKRPEEADYVRPGLDEFARLMHRDYVQHSGTLVRRSCHSVVGDYDTRLPHAGDWDLWLRLCTRFAVGYVSDPLYAYRIHGNNMHHSNVSPNQANDEHVLVIQKAFAALQPDAPAWLRQQYSGALRGAWLLSTEVECSSGRTGRAWLALADALRRHPIAAAGPELYLQLAKLVMNSLFGFERYARLASWWRARRIAHVRRGAHTA